LITGASASDTSNAAATNGNVWLNLIENSTTRNTHNIVGSGGTTVVCDSAGKITISSTDTNTDTKVTSVSTHYTPASGTAKTATASGTQLAFGGAVITGVNVDAAGHIYSLTTSALPNNPNTDTKVTAVGNHYTPSGGTTLTGTSSNTLGFGGQVMTGVTRDAAGHITGATFANLPANPVSSYSFTTGAGGTKTMAEFLTYMTGRFYASNVRSSYTLTVTTQNTVLYNAYGDLDITVNMNGWDYANIIVVGHASSSNGKTLIVQTSEGNDVYENADCGLITTTSSKNIVETSIVRSAYGTFVSMRNYGEFT
jgi:hypothetical protein